MTTRKRTRVLLGGLLLLSGCSHWQHVSIHSVEYNLAVEKAHNELLLLNILRAADRRPMHFTAFSQIKGNLSSSFGSGGKATLGAGATDVDLTPSASVSSKPTYDVCRDPCHVCRVKVDKRRDGCVWKLLGASR